MGELQEVPAPQVEYPTPPTPGVLPITYRWGVTRSVVAIVLRALSLCWQNLGIIVVLTLLLKGPWVVLTILRISRSASLQNDPARAFRANNFLFFIIDALLAPVLIYAIITHLNTGKRAHLGAALKWGLHKWWTTFLCSLGAGVYIILGLVALIVPGIIALIRYSLINVVVAVEGAADWGALRRSKSLVKGWEWRIFGAYALMTFFLLLAVVVLSIPSGFTEAWWVTAYANSVVYLLMNIFTVLSVALYLNLTSDEEIPRTDGLLPPPYQGPSEIQPVSGEQETSSST